MRLHAPDYNSTEEWALSPLTRPQQDQEKEGRTQVDSDAGCGCDSKAVTTMSQELSLSTAHAEHRAKKHQYGNNAPATLEKKKNKIATPGKQCTKIYIKKRYYGKKKEIT